MSRGSPPLVGHVLFVVLVGWCLSLRGLAASAPATREYHIAAGEASVTLAEFSQQSGEQIVYLIDHVRGERTNAVDGQLSPRDAIEQLLAGSALTVHRDPTSGAMIVSRRTPTTTQPDALRTRQARAKHEAADADEVVVLSAFTVSSDAADRYRAADAISAVRVRAALIDTPASITVATREMIDDLAPTRIFDVTRFVAGIQDGRGLQFQDRMIIRGFESNGQRSVDNFLQPDDADNVDEAIIERIEVTKGPNAILSPAGAPGGSINVVTKSPLFQRQRSLTAVVGLFDAQKVTLDFAGPVAPGSALAYRMVGSLQDSRRYWDASARLRGRVLAPMLAWRPSPKTELTLKLIGAEHWIFREPLVILDPAVNARTREPFLGPGLSPKGRNGIQPWSHVGTHTVDLLAQLTTELAQNVELRVAANGRYYFEDSEQDFLSTPNLTNRYDPATGELTQDFTWALNPATGAYESTFAPFYDPTNIPNRGDLQATRRKTGNFQADIVARRQTSEVSSQTVAGFAFSRRTSQGRGHNTTLPGIDITAPERRFDPVYDLNAYSFYNRSSFSNWQAYVNQRFGFDEDRIHFTGGVLHYATDTFFRNVLTGAEPARLNDHKGVWMASVLWKVRDDVSLYYSRSTNSAPTVANDQPLWRTGVQNEAGFKSEFFNQRLSLTGAWFEIEQSNVTIPNPARQTDPTAPETLIADFGNHGFEFELMGRLTENLSAIATYSHLNMRDSLGRHVRGVADNNAALLVNYRFTDGTLAGLALNAGVTYSSRRAGDVPINFTPLGVIGRTSFFLKPYYATIVGASYPWREKFLFRVTVDNVLDDRDFIVLAGGRVSGTGITTQPGLNVKLSTTVEF